MLPITPNRQSLLHRAILAGLLIFTCVGSTGCVTSILANKITRAPNLQSTPTQFRQFAAYRPVLDQQYYSLALKIPVSPHPALISVGVIEPGDYQLKHELKSTAKDHKTVVSLDMSFAKRAETASPTSPKATIFVLHGVMMAKESMLHWGFFLAEKGYRVVLVDLRGHGQSSGDLISYGAWEPADLSQVLDELTRRQVIVGRVGVLGLSYGGAVAIDWAARDPRVTSVVALAPFSDARKAIDEFAHALMPTVVSHVSPEKMAAALALAAKRGQFTWEETDVVAAAHQLRQPILLFHGSNDQWIPLHHSQTIKAAAPSGSALRVGQGDHLTLSVRLAPIAEQASAWFDKALAF
ncbi:MAG: alpha/beta fold hydrolase [Opitutaceae bacterium]